MSQSTTDLKGELKKNVERLGTLRDEIRLKLHLAGMDAKDQWKHLETELLQVEADAAQAATEATRTALDGTIKKLNQFRDSLG